MSLLQRALNDLRVAEAIELLGIGKTTRYARAAARDSAHTRRQMEKLMGSIQDLSSKVDALTTDVQRLVTEMRDALDRINSGELSPENQAAIDDIATKVDQLDAAVEAVSPEPAAPVEDETPVEPSA